MCVYTQKLIDRKENISYNDAKRYKYRMFVFYRHKTPVYNFLKFTQFAV